MFAKNTLEWYWGKNVPGKPYTSADWETLDAPSDFVEKSRWLTFIFVPKEGEIRIVVDSDNRIEEIIEDNNEVVLKK